jgi:HNH endonuclease
MSIAAVWLRDEGRCRICGEDIDKDGPIDGISNATLDHVIPAARGGKHEMGNVQLAHARCNGEKGALTTEEARALREIRLAWRQYHEVRRQAADGSIDEALLAELTAKIFGGEGTGRLEIPTDFSAGTASAGTHAQSQN